MIKLVDIRLFENILQDIFKLKSRPHIRVSQEIKFDGDSCYGLYTGEPYNKRFLHKIRVSRAEINNNEQLFATMAHEYVHAWQMENNKEVDHEIDSKFEYWVNYFNIRFNINIIGMI